MTLRANTKTATPVLRAQFSNRFAASEVWNQLFPKGTWHGANLAPIGGSITIDDAMLEELVANWRAAGAPPLPVYKTHGHLDEDVTPLERAELSKAYGYLTDFRVTAEGLEAKTEWTPAGKAMVDAGEFAFWSPEWQPRHRDRRTGDVKGWWLSGTALCSDPFFNEMPPVAASADAETTDPTPQHRSNTMNEEQLKALRAKLKLAADATPEQIIAAAHVQDSTTLTASAITAQIAPIKAELEKAQAELEKVRTERVVEQAESLIASAKQAGKMVESFRPLILKAAKSEGLEAAKAIVEMCPKGMSTTEQGVSGTGETITATTAKEKLDAIADANIKAGMPRSKAMELAMSANPELSRAAQKLTNPTPQSV